MIHRHNRGHFLKNLTPGSAGMARPAKPEVGIHGMRGTNFQVRPELQLPRLSPTPDSFFPNEIPDTHVCALKMGVMASSPDFPPSRRGC
jgi:hypothetical protein